MATDTAGNLYIADALNGRVLEYNTPLKVTAVTGSGDTTADAEIGNCYDVAGNYRCPSGLATINGIQVGSNNYPAADSVAVDSKGNVFVADTGANRVLAWNQPLAACSSFPCWIGAASRVFGQNGNFTTEDCNGGIGPGDLERCWAG